MELPFRIPDALLPIITGFVLWFVVCFIWLAPALTTRAIELSVASECEANTSHSLCQCLFEDIQLGRGAVMNALFLSSFTLSEPRIGLWGEKRNPYITYISQQMQHTDRRRRCDSSLRYASTQQLEKQHEAEKASAQRGFNPQLEQERQFLQAQQKQQAAIQQAAQQAAREAALHRAAQQAAQEAVIQQAENLARQGQNSSAGQYAQEQWERAKRADQLRERTTDMGLDLWESGLKWLEKKRWEYERRQRYEP